MSATPPPLFLYAAPLDPEHAPLEETCLVGWPALGLDELRRRLERRLAARGVRLTGREGVERVRFQRRGRAPRRPARAQPPVYARSRSVPGPG